MVVWLCGCVAHEDAGGMRCGVVCGMVRWPCCLVWVVQVWWCVWLLCGAVCVVWCGAEAHGGHICNDVRLTASLVVHLPAFAHTPPFFPH